MPPSAVASRARNVAIKAVAAAVLLAVGLVLAALYRIVGVSEQHAYAPGAQPANSVRITAGRTYQLSVPGGATALHKRGIGSGTLQCEWSSNGSASQVLAVTTESSDKATNTVATFTGPFTGEIHVDCLGWGTMFVDDADDASFDLAGLFLLLSILALGVGAGLGLSALRGARTDADGELGRATREDEDIERLVHVVHLRSEDREVGGADSGDLAP